MSMHPWKLNKKQIQEKIDKVNKTILREENLLKKPSLSEIAIATIKKSLQFLGLYKQKLEKEEKRDKYD